MWYERMQEDAGVRIQESELHQCASVGGHADHPPFETHPLLGSNSSSLSIQPPILLITL
jgi:hypothetical protein